MNRLASLSAIALLAGGCASAGKPGALSAKAAPLPIARSTPPASRVVELRHFYLLSPGPGARLVVTRRDADGEAAPAAAAPAAGLQ